MSDDRAGKALIPLTEQALVTQGANENRLIRRAVSDARVSMDALSSSLKTMLRRVGDYEFHEEDYRQLEIWAEALGLTILETVRYIDVPKSRLPQPHLGPFYQGRIYSLESDDATVFEFLEILPGLEMISCEDIGLKHLSLAEVPSLWYITCYNNKLTDLDLSGVPALAILGCHNNQLTALDLSPVPALTELTCSNNRVTELDISICPKLKRVWVDPWVKVKQRDDQVVHRVGK